MGRAITMTDELYRYLLEHSLRDHPVLRELREETSTLPMARMQVAPEQGQFLALLARLKAEDIAGEMEAVDLAPAIAGHPADAHRAELDHIHGARLVTLREDHRIGRIECHRTGFGLGHGAGSQLGCVPHGWNGRAGKKYG